MILVPVILCFLLLYCSSAIVTGKCSATVKGELQTQELDCSVALFSKGSFHIHGKLVVLSDDLCEPSESLRKYANSIVAVKRGQCAFDQKAVNANVLKFKALIVLNVEDSFPMGASNVEYVSPIPVLMVRTHNILEIAAVQISLTYEDKASTVSKVNLERTSIKKSLDYLINCLGCALVIVMLGSTGVILYRAVQQWQFYESSPPSSVSVISHASQYDAIIQVICVLALCLLFVLMRLGTFRLLPALNNSSSLTSTAAHDIEVINSQFNHKETDELIFQKLTEYVSRDMFDYTLKDKDIIRQFNLAPENYSDSLFIHPPLFVYLSTFLMYCCHFSLPALPILYQLVTLLLVPAITPYIDPTIPLHARPSSYLVNSTSLTAMTILLCCPVCMFCSQKFWIDNCLVLCVSICVAGHLRLLDTRKLQASQLKNDGDNRVVTTQYVPCFLSGLVLFGGVAMYCKITSLGLLPFLLGWIVLQRGTINNSKSRLLDCLKHVGLFLMGSVLSYGPWAILYHHHTGRWMPNAWPSETMLRNSSFVRAAVNKPFYYYLQVLLSFSPCHVIGILLGAVLALKLVRNFRSLFTGTTITSPSSVGFLKLVVFSLWPASFLAGITLLGLRGAGYQSRFLLPLLPASAILCSIAVNIFQCPSLSSGGSAAVGRTSGELLLSLVLSLCLLYSVMHSIYYGVLYAPLFAELDNSLLDILSGIVNNPYAPPGNRESFEDTLKYMAHFGLHKR